MPRSSTFAPSDYNSALKHFHIASINRPPRQSLVPMNFDSIPELPRRTDGIEQQKNLWEKNRLNCFDLSLQKSPSTPD
jgi:hypothetical protein